MKKYLFHLLFVSLLVSQLNVYGQRYTASELAYDTYPVQQRDVKDSSLLKLLKPYSDSVKKTMSKVIGFATSTLYEKQPESPLGNFMADAMKVMVEKKFGRKIDAAVMNAGGIRSYIPKGDITLQHAFELMPFDNTIVLQEIQGAQLKRYLDFTASKGGWAVSGIRMQIKDHKADSIYINEKPLEENAIYVLASTDYVAKGGDNSIILKDIPMLNIGYLYRDAIVEYIQQFTKNGKAVTAVIERRVVNAD
jgi:2',3'-cyclic-nucleotide 2'-phosphodiesterase (5'-nucleotidase family)